MITGPEMRKVVLDDLLEMESNPRQRDTKKRAARALKGHLSVPIPKHYLVASARCHGIDYLVDGHTRLELWRTGKLKLPKRTLALEAWECDHLSEVGEIYGWYDNQAAAKRAPDRLYGACQEQGVVFGSDLMRRGGVSTALSLVVGEFGIGFDEMDSVLKWKEELLWIDSWGLSKRQIPSMVLAAALICVRRYGFGVKAFFLGLANGGGCRQNGQSDGIDALSRLLERRRLEKTLTGRDNLYDVAGKTLACVRSWKEGREYVGGVKGLDWEKCASQYREKPR